MDELRKMHLKENWSHETDEAWTQEWLEELDPALSWTKKAAQRRQPLDCMTQMCQ